jgi:hypothetical protein
LNILFKFKWTNEFEGIWENTSENMLKLSSIIVKIWFIFIGHIRELDLEFASSILFYYKKKWMELNEKWRGIDGPKRVLWYWEINQNLDFVPSIVLSMGSGRRNDLIGLIKNDKKNFGGSNWFAREWNIWGRRGWRQVDGLQIWRSFSGQFV